MNGTGAKVRQASMSDYAALAAPRSVYKRPGPGGDATTSTFLSARSQSSARSCSGAMRCDCATSAALLRVESDRSALYGTRYSDW